jgi:PST family polysaccharide transporter
MFGLRRHTQDGILADVTALYGIHLAGYLLPLALIPFLARTLGPDGWGRLALAQALTGFLAVLVEYGFHLSATREVARLRDDIGARSELIAGVVGGKSLLALCGFGIAVATAIWIPALGEQPRLVVMATLAGLAQAYSVVWYFQGMGRLREAAFVELSCKLLGAGLIFLFIREPSDVWKVPGIQAAATLLSLGILASIVFRENRIVAPTLATALNRLNRGWSIFLLRGATTLYTTGNAFLLGIFVTPQFVGYFAGAEKTSRACTSLLQPMSLVLYPRLSRLTQTSRREAEDLIRWSLWTMGLAGILIATGLAVAAPLIVSLVFGQGYQPTVPALRLLALLAPLSAISNVLGMQWMLPLGLERPYNTLVIGAGLLNILLGSLLAPQFAHMGMATAVVVSEASITAGILVVLSRRRLLPNLGFREAKQSEGMTAGAGPSRVELVSKDL